MTYQIQCPWLWVVSSVAGRNSKSPGPPPMSGLQIYPLQNIASTPVQVLEYHLIRAVRFPFSFVNGCFCCWLQLQLSFLLSHYQKTEQWWWQFENNCLALKQNSCYHIKKGVVLTTRAYSNLTRPFLELKHPFLQFQWRLSQGNKSRQLPRITEVSNKCILQRLPKSGSSVSRRAHLYGPLVLGWQRSD